jgi:flagellar biosynthesis protein FlgN
MTSFGANPAAGLAQELDAARQLMNLLKQEQTQLVEADIEGLSALVEQKSVLISRMSELATLRLNALAEAGFAAEEASMQKWLDSSAAASGNRAATKKAWDELLKLIQSAKEMNRTNGLLIGTHMSRNQTALQVLQGSQGSQVYGPDGQTNVQSSRRSLIVG